MVLSNAGAHVPMMPFSEATGKVIAGAPLQMAGIGSKVGRTAGSTVTVRVAVVAHCPASGVKVYSVVVVLSNTGAQVPVMPFSEVTGKVMAGAPLQIAEIGSKVG